MITIKKCERIINRLKKDFPAVEKVKLEVKIKPLKLGSMRIVRHLFNKYIIIIDPEMYPDANEKEIMGGLAHELCHLEHDNKISFFKYLVYLGYYLISKRFMVKTEIENDINTIKKGYGNELIANRSYRERKNPRNKLIEKSKRPFMLSKEIKNYMEENDARH